MAFKFKWQWEETNNKIKQENHPRSKTRNVVYFPFKKDTFIKKGRSMSSIQINK